MPVRNFCAQYVFHNIDAARAEVLERTVEERNVACKCVQPVINENVHAALQWRLSPEIANGFGIELIAIVGFDALGFEKTIEVPHADKLGFVALQKDGTEVMYQTYASLGDDMPQVAEAAKKGPIA